MIAIDLFVCFFHWQSEKEREIQRSSMDNVKRLSGPAVMRAHSKRMSGTERNGRIAFGCLYKAIRVFPTHCVLTINVLGHLQWSKDCIDLIWCVWFIMDLFCWKCTRLKHFNIIFTPATHAPRQKWRRYFKNLCFKNILWDSNLHPFCCAATTASLYCPIVIYTISQ